MTRPIDTEPHLAALLEQRKARRAAPPYIPQVDSEVRGLLEKFFAREEPGATIGDVSRLGGGASKEQFVFSLTTKGGEPQRYVLRMDPEEAITETSRSREWDVLRAMKGVVPVPQPIWIDAEGSTFPRPALIMEMMPGSPKPTSLDLSVTGLGTVLGDPLRDTIRPQYLDMLVAIHNFDWRSADLPSFAAPEEGGDADPKQATRWLIGFWKELLEQDAVAKEPVIRLATQWLEANIPDCDELSLVHGDFRTGNYLFDEATGEVTALLDWEMSYIGDRHADFGWLLQPVFGTVIDGTFRASDIFAGEDDFIAAYEAAGGRPVDRKRLQYFTVFNNWKSYILVSVLGMRAAKEAHNHQDVLLTFLAATGPQFVDELARLLTIDLGQGDAS
ncbi:MAG: phosphotransferase family protein [Parerythrobacter sp.]